MRSVLFVNNSRQQKWTFGRGPIKQEVDIFSSLDKQKLLSNSAKTELIISCHEINISSV